MPPVVTQLRRGLRLRRATGSRTPEPVGSRDLDGHADSGGDQQDRAPDATTDDTGEPDTADDPADVDTWYDPYGPPTAPPDNPDPTTPATEHPARSSEPDPATLMPAVTHLWPAAGVGLTGEAAEAAARGFLAATLASGVDDPHDRGIVVMPASTCATLLGADAVALARSPRLIITAGLPEALALLEQHTLHRSRAVFDAEVSDLAALRDAEPFAEPLPPLVLISDITMTHERARIAALLIQGQRLDIRAILLGAWPAGDTVHVAADGTTRPAALDTIRHRAHPTTLDRLSVLTPEQTVDLVRVFAEAHTGEPPSITLNTYDVDVAAPADAGVDIPPNDEKAGPSAGAAPRGAADASPTPEAEDAGVHEGVGAAAPGTAPAVQGRVTVRLLGHPELLRRPVRPVFRLKAMELLAYLAVQNAPTHRDYVLEDVLGYTRLEKAPMHLNTFVTNVRNVCKVIGGSGTYLHRDKDLLSLEPAAFDLDVWRLRDALAIAETTTDAQQRIDALRTAVDTYTGEFAHGCDYDWAEPYRQALRTQALDAAGALADALVAAGRADEAADVLTTAIDVHPYAEELYRQAMRLHATRHDLDAVRQLHRTLTQRLCDLDAVPTDDTVALVDRLVAAHRRHGTAKPPRTDDS